MTISTHQILKLQLESDSKGKLWIVNHTEIHSTQGVLSRLISRFDFTNADCRQVV